MVVPNWRSTRSSNNSTRAPSSTSAPLRTIERPCRAAVSCMADRTSEQISEGPIHANEMRGVAGSAAGDVPAVTAGALVAGCADCWAGRVAAGGRASGRRVSAAAPVTAAADGGSAGARAGGAAVDGADEAGADAGGALDALGGSVGLTGTLPAAAAAGAVGAGASTPAAGEACGGGDAGGWSANDTAARGRITNA
jgi:hypothetical protein